MSRIVISPTGNARSSKDSIASKVNLVLQCVGRSEKSIVFADRLFKCRTGCPARFYEPQQRVTHQRYCPGDCAHEWLCSECASPITGPDLKIAIRTHKQQQHKNATAIVHHDLSVEYIGDLNTEKKKNIQHWGKIGS